MTFRLALLLMAGLLASCSMGTRLAYQNLDTLVRLEVKDFVDLDDAQDALLDKEFGALWAWHRREELPAYALALRSTADAAEQGALDRAAVDRIAQTINDALARLADRALPGLARLLASLSDAQVHELLKAQQKELDETLEEQEDETPAETLKRLTGEFQDRLENWIGKLNPEQRRYLAQRMAEAEARGEFALARQRADAAEGQRQFAALLATRKQSDFAAGLQALLLPQDASAQAERALRRERGRGFYTALAATLSEHQRQRFAKRLRSYADDASALAAKATPP